MNEKLRRLIDRCGLTEEDLKNPYLVADIEENLDLMDFYGLCPVHLDNLSTYEHFVRKFGEPYPYLGDKEPIWEYVITFTAKDQYAKITDWTIEMAFREVLQNALDGANELGYTSDDVVVNYDEKRGLLVVENPSKRLSYEHMVFGGSEKPCWSRGRYGEGLKVAASFFTKRGGTIYVISHDVAFRFISLQKYIVLLLGRARERLYGRTAVYIHDRDAKKLSKLVDKILFKERGRDFVYRSMINGSSYGCAYDAKCAVASKVSDLGVLYVRDMFVNDFKEIVGVDSIFDYNLWWIDLSRDRIHVTSTYRLYEQVAKVLSNLSKKDMEKVVDEIINKCAGLGLSSGGVFVEFGGDWLELRAISDNYYHTYEFRKVLTDRLIKRFNLNPSFVGYDTSASWVDKALYLGYTPVIYTSPTTNPPFVLPSLFDLIKEHAKKSAEQLKEHRFTLEDLDKDLMETIISEYGAKTLKWLISALGFVKMFELVFSHMCKIDMDKVYFTTFDDKPSISKRTIARYDHEENSIYFGIDRIAKWKYKHRPFDVAAEECIHALSEAGDVSAEFEKYLIRYLNDYFTYVARNPDYTVKHNMAKSGFYKYLLDEDYRDVLNRVLGIKSKARRIDTLYTQSYSSAYAYPGIFPSSYSYNGTWDSLALVSSHVGIPPVFLVDDKKERLLFFNWFSESALTMYYLEEWDALARYVKDTLTKTISKDRSQGWIRNSHIFILDSMVDLVCGKDFEEV